MAHLLTKSKFIRGLQCEKALYLDVYHPEAARISKETRLKFKAGRDFEAAYKATYPTAIDVSRILGRRINRYPELTQELLAASDEVILFEAGFRYNDTLVLADVVRKDADGRLYIHEVKNSQHVTPTFRNDVAVQYYVISHLHPIAEFSLVYHDEQGQFLKEDLTQEACVRLSETEGHIIRFKQVLSSTQPAIGMGPHCDNPYECPYKACCRGLIPMQLEIQ